MKKLLLFTGIIAILSSLPLSTDAASPLDPACRNLTDAQRAESTACSTNREQNQCANDAGDETSKKCNPISGGTNGILYKITRIVALAAGSIAVIMMIVGGIGMMVASGDSQKFSNSRNTLIFAAVGLVIVVAANALVSFVINSFFP